MVAIWRHFGRLPGCLGAFLADQVFQNYCKNDAKQQFSTPLLFATGGTWDGFWRPCWLILGRFWGPNWIPKNIKNFSEKGTQKLSLFGARLGPFWGLF